MCWLYVLSIFLFSIIKWTLNKGFCRRYSNLLMDFNGFEALDSFLSLLGSMPHPFSLYFWTHFLIWLGWHFCKFSNVTFHSDLKIFVFVSLSGLVSLSNYLLWKLQISIYMSLSKKYFYLRVQVWLPLRLETLFLCCYNMFWCLHKWWLSLHI